MDNVEKCRWILSTGDSMDKWDQGPKCCQGHLSANGHIHAYIYVYVTASYSQRLKGDAQERNSKRHGTGEEL